MKSEILSITDYKSMLVGEIESVIYHNPSDDEVAIFERYIADYLADCISAGKKPNLTELCVIIHDCRHDHFKECTECGEYFPFDEMNPDFPDYCRACKPVYDPDMMPGGHDDLIADTWNGLFSQN